MDHLMSMQLDVSYRREVAYRWAEQRNLRRMAKARGRRLVVPPAIWFFRQWISVRQQVVVRFWRHARRAGTARSSA